MRRIDEFWIELLPPAQKPPKVSRGWLFFYEWLDSVIGAILIIFLLFTFLYRPVGVDGASMVPTLEDGDWLAVSTLTFRPKTKDIVVITQPNDVHEPLIKRVIAVGGDTIDINFASHKVIVNGEVLNEPYIAEETSRKFDTDFPITIPPGYVFVMGDNRNQSKDSRASGIGLIDERYILGKAQFRFIPFGSFTIYSTDKK